MNAAIAAAIAQDAADAAYRIAENLHDQAAATSELVRTLIGMGATADVIAAADRVADDLIDQRDAAYAAATEKYHAAQAAAEDAWDARIVESATAAAAVYNATT